MKKKVLIVCHSYPPNPGVGGRRWAIFTKYLIDSGVEVHVLTKQPHPKSSSPWIEYVKSAKIHYYKNKYPSILENIPKTAAHKVCYRVVLFALKLLSISNYYDRGVLSRKIIFNKIKFILEHEKINNLIISGAPFSFLYYGAMIKQQKDYINYISDIRDPWIDSNYFGFSNLSKARKKEELFRINMVLNFSDITIVPITEMKGNYQRINKNSTIDIFPHAVDDELILPRSTHEVSKKQWLNLVNFGTHYTKLYEIMEAINKSINGTRLQVSFYTTDYQYQNIFKQNPNVIYHKTVSQRRVFKILSETDAALFFVNEDIKDFISTKYIEAIASRTPIVLVGEEGKVSELIEANNLGVFICASKILNEFGSLRNHLKNLKYNERFDYSELTFKNQTKKLLTYLK